MCKSRFLVKCTDCGKELYIDKISMSKPTFTGLCHSCYILKRLEKNHKMKRDRAIEERPRTKRTDGYIEVILPPWHWCFPMVSKTRHSVLVHRLVMAEYLGRLLEKSEIVHHINGVRADNRIENLELKNPSNHPQSYQDGYDRGLKDGISIRDKQLEKQIRFLQWQIKELTKVLQFKMVDDVKRNG